MEVLHGVYLMSVAILKPRDPEFKSVHPRLKGPRFSPFFDNCIGAIDGTHIKVVVPADKLVQHVGSPWLFHSKCLGYLRLRHAVYLRCCWMAGLGS